MSDYILSCCSTADLDKKTFDELDISYIPFHFSLNGVEYEDDFGKTISYEDFYARMKKGEDTKTSQVTVGEFVNYFEKFLIDGKDILHVTLSSGISGVYSSAYTASQQLKEKYPNRKIFIVDSLAASSGYGLLMYKLAMLKKENLSIEDLKSYAEAHKLNVNHWFFSTDLSFYVKGGRIKKASAVVASVLHICPVLDVNEKGQLTPKEKPISVKMAINSLIKKMKLLANNNENYNDDVFICHSVCENYVNNLITNIKKNFPNIADEKIKVFPIGTTIGAHTGPGTVALFFIGKSRGIKE